MDKKSIRDAANVIYSLCSKNGNNRLTGYFLSSSSNMWLNNKGDLVFKNVTREKNNIFETVGTVMEDSLIMKQIQKSKNQTYYDLISWTADGERCTVVNFEIPSDLDKAYEGIIEKYRVFIGPSSIETIFSNLEVNYSNINYVKLDINKKKKTQEITAESLVDELECSRQVETQERKNNYKAS